MPTSRLQLLRLGYRLVDAARRGGAPGGGERPTGDAKRVHEEWNGVEESALVGERLLTVLHMVRTFRCIWLSLSAKNWLGTRAQHIFSQSLCAYNFLCVFWRQASSAAAAAARYDEKGDSFDLFSYTFAH
jgi:hypothetical protein